MANLHGSVGLGGRNWRPDVVVVQRLLTAAEVSPGPVDGRCGRRTMQAIERFQAPFLHRPDGRVDVGGPTWRHLERTTAAAASAPAPSPYARPGRHASPAGSSRGAPHALSAPARPAAAPRPSAAAAPHPASPRPASAPSPEPPADGTHAAGYWVMRTPLGAQGSVNRGLTCPGPVQMERALGDPHGSKTKSHLRTSHVGPLHVTGLVPALDSLAQIFANVRRDLPDLYPRVGTQGMHCLRNIRGRSCYSNHSWGTAIDLTIDRFLIDLGETRSCKGVDALVPYFNAAGWYWGGGYHGRKDCMHFECGLELVRSFNL